MLLKNTDIKHLGGFSFKTGILSLKPLIDYLQKIVDSKEGQHNLLPRFGLEMIKGVEHRYGAICEGNLEPYEGVFEMIYAMQDGLRLESKGLWGLGSPIPHQIFYGTAELYHFLETDAELILNKKMEGIMLIQLLLYRVILERFYNIPEHSDKNILYKVNQDGVDRYYELQVDFSFVDIQRKGELPTIDLTVLRDKEVLSIEDLKPIFRVLDPNNFTFEGLTILTFQDKTISYVSEWLHTLTSDLPQYTLKPFFEELRKIMSTIAGSKEIGFSLLPILELNGYPILSPDFAQDCLFFSEIQTRKDAGEITPAIMSFCENPHPILYGIEKSLDTDDPIFRKLIEQKGISSYVCVPLKHHQKLVGFVELYSRRPNVLTKSTMVTWHRFMPLLANLAAETLFIFKSRLERIVLNNFTALNPAVEWRFNEVAVGQLASYMRQEGERPLETVRFEKVYPIYGAVDVKGSTQLRNSIYRKDNLSRVNRLEQFLQTLPPPDAGSSLDLLIQRTDKIRTRLESKQYDRYMQETYLFLHEELFMILRQIKTESPDFGTAIENFIARQQEVSNNSRDIFETSLQLLNGLIKEEVKQFNDCVQAIFPSYFELFRSDGVEYDMYVGQSITPTKDFQKSYLREIRKQQIIAMARIGKRAAQIEKSLPVPMQVTLLIFVHALPIDISFREDERRFDVEGGYNIRYQMLKKRIDKAYIKDRGERLVKPNTLAIVFQGNTTEHEIASLLKEVAEEGFLKQEVESCTLEEIQGVSEIKALRVPIALEDMPEN
ncbi:GAF domain-containing protein [Sphingobacterium wenxiniae]|uniref:GAF domain-containing protein n=1 Tax=Sphingobacterium wenxiniae TaxID=683125 RepID=A0A1I6S7Y3_9SPHI|nr:GAF domain-containing protein [Sphingobacterium wenxiniae]SFS73099.1 hypothetical protein SAMN05660206_104156 [Sphingobacterium wenxiniae]